MYAAGAEAENIRAKFSDTFAEEGLAFYVYGVGAEEATKVTRFRSLVAPETYLYATGTEAEAIRTDFAETFAVEGAAFEVAI
ncbi:MAG TPA: hypothetical protein ACFCUY_09930 [Xenococcaceae cyanobacterium]